MGVATALLPIFATKFLGSGTGQEVKRMETTDPKTPRSGAFSPV